MIKDKRGEGGFMEAMLALMMVTVALTAFLSMLAYCEIGVSLDTDFIEDARLIDGRIVIEADDRLDRFVDLNGLNGARLSIRIAGTLSDASLTRSSGTEDGDNVSAINGTFPIGSDDGRVFVASYEVVYWWD